MDKARVTYAIAKSNKNMEKYIEMFDNSDNESLRKILDWKIKRVMKWLWGDGMDDGDDLVFLWLIFISFDICELNGW